ncbi:MAG: hypothetical protein IKX47_06175 [Oscillospiraceae bacterium]|nr:hypothetical protein [Oscillospiraceae bacterium]
MKKKVLYTELAYALGMVGLSLSVALMTRADFGVSMVVAPAYLLYLKLNPVWPFFTFGMAEYTLQAVLLLFTILAVKKFRPYFLFSFVTAVLYGFLLDGWMLATAALPAGTLALRGAWYVLGLVLGAASIAFFFKTYIAPEVYELLVKELAEKLGKPTHRVKTVYDCVSCAAAIIMSFAFFGLGRFEGVKWGTVVCALVNGWLIGRFTALYEKRFDFQDALPWRKYFS